MLKLSEIRYGFTMDPCLIFIYDGECPFCNHFAELIELKSQIPNLQIKNARDFPDELPLNYDMDINGAILLEDGKVFTGANAINIICSQINHPSGNLIKILSMFFSSNIRAKLIFPFLIISRRIALYLKGIPRKISLK